MHCKQQEARKSHRHELKSEVKTSSSILTVSVTHSTNSTFDSRDSKWKMQWIGFAWGMDKLLRNSEGPLTTSSSCIFAGISIEISLVLMTSVRRILTQQLVKSDQTVHTLGVTASRSHGTPAPA